ncbi:MAG: relaxase/mobilization nuclease domain-containing protein [Eggerthellaceae bacterium]|nr:relaxase/mobilization nuclease domain-containing protein [Eggerthellaceae bacterium]
MGLMTMTAIKQVSVNTPAHAANLARYLDDGRAIARGSQHITREESWQREMERTRAAYGHDVPSREGAANTIMYHQVLAFNPDECEMNGGKVTPALAMVFARDWVQTRYPNQEAVWVLHREFCAADKTSRYAVHIGINRTDLATGRRLHEGKGRQAKVERAKAVRALDERYGLAQMVAGKRNSRVHARQPTRAEREMAARGERAEKQYIREAVTVSMMEARGSVKGDAQRVFEKALEVKGVVVTASRNGDDYVYRRVKTGFRVSGHKLGRGFSMTGITKGLAKSAARNAARSVDEDRER